MDVWIDGEKYMITYEEMQNRCASLEEYISNQSFDFEEEIKKGLKECPSRLDAYDFVFAITLGTIGAFVDTSEKLASFLDEIHEISNSDKPNSENKIIDLLAKLVKHKGDWIDQVPILNKDGTLANKFVNRAAQKVGTGIWDGRGNTPHRVFWGHDIFSLGQDNPFFLSIKQYGLFKGVLQAMRHLLADTCSKQGLPIPTSSWWDSAPNEEGSISNGLLDFCQKYSEEVFGKKFGGGNNEVFNHLFSIHMQDALTVGLAIAGVKGYCYARDIKDEERILQIQIITLGFEFFGGAVLGGVKTSIPYINWPCFGKMTVSLVKLVKKSNENINELEQKTYMLLLEGDDLRDKEKTLRTDLLDGIKSAVDSDGKKDRDELIDFLGGE